MANVNVEEIKKALLESKEYSVELGGGNKLLIQHTSGEFYSIGELDYLHVCTLDVGCDDDGDTIYYVGDGEYFPTDHVDDAIECFIARIKNHNYSNRGWSLEDIKLHYLNQ